MAPCHWAWTLTGVDPGAAWRGKYHSAEQAEENLVAGGGMVRLVDRTLRTQGWRRTAEPVSGDFGVVSLADCGRTRFGAVRYGSLWLLATSDGLLEIDGRTRAAWAPPNGL